MQSLNLEKFGVQEMNAKEMRESTGGSFFGFLGVFALAAAIVWTAANFVNDVLIHQEPLDISSWN